MQLNKLRESYPYNSGTCWRFSRPYLRISHTTVLDAILNKYSEELAYPGIFVGQKRPENDDRPVDVHYSDICKSELRQSDRIAAMCIENFFFKTKKLQMKILLGK